VLASLLPLLVPLLPVAVLGMVLGAGGLPWGLLGGAGSGLLLLSLLLSALAESGSSILCSSCCGSGWACPTLTYEGMLLKALLFGAFHCRLKGLPGA
jgi:hypothetical protein